MTGDYRSTPAHYLWSIEPPSTEPPATPTIDSAPASETDNFSAYLRFSSETPDVRFFCRLDGADFNDCRSPKRYHSLNYGRHTFEVKARNAANMDSGTASVNWMVVDLPPVPSDPPASAPTASGPGPDPSGHADDQLRSAEYHGRNERHLHLLEHDGRCLLPLPVGRGGVRLLHEPEGLHGARSRHAPVRGEGARRRSPRERCGSADVADQRAVSAHAGTSAGTYGARHANDRVRPAGYDHRDHGGVPVLQYDQRSLLPLPARRGCVRDLCEPQELYRARPRRSPVRGEGTRRRWVGERRRVTSLEDPGGDASASGSRSDATRDADHRLRTAQCDERHHRVLHLLEHDGRCLVPLPGRRRCVHGVHEPEELRWARRRTAQVRRQGSKLRRR